MKLKIDYYGSLAETIAKKTETLEVDEGVTTSELNEIIYKMYPVLRGFVFKIAVNLSIADENKKLNQQDEIVLLPPFAGG